MYFTLPCKTALFTYWVLYIQLFHCIQLRYSLKKALENPERKKRGPWLAITVFIDMGLEHFEVSGIDGKWKSVNSQSLQDVSKLDFWECGQECRGLGVATLGTSGIPLILFIHNLAPIAQLESWKRKSCAQAFITFLIFKLHSQLCGKKLKNHIAIPKPRIPKVRGALGPEAGAQGRGLAAWVRFPALCSLLTRPEPLRQARHPKWWIHNSLKNALGIRCAFWLRLLCMCGNKKERGRERDYQPERNPMSNREAGLVTDKAVNCEQFH